MTDNSCLPQQISARIGCCSTEFLGPDIIVFDIAMSSLTRSRPDKPLISMRDLRTDLGVPDGTRHDCIPGVLCWCGRDWTSELRAPVVHFCRGIDKVTVICLNIWEKHCLQPHFLMNFEKNWEFPYFHKSSRSLSECLCPRKNNDKVPALSDGYSRMSPCRRRNVTVRICTKQEQKVYRMFDGLDWQSYLISRYKSGPEHYRAKWHFCDLTIFAWNIRR
jgi:hypothetical protein